MTFRFPVYVSSTGALTVASPAVAWTICYTGLAPTVDLQAAGIAPAVTEIVATKGIYTFSIDIKATGGVYGVLDLGALNVDANGKRYMYFDCTAPDFVKTADIWEWSGGGNRSTPVSGAGTETVTRSDVVTAATNTWSVTDDGATRVRTRLT